MKSYYDKDVDSLGISLDSKCYEETIELCAGVYIDIDKDGKPIGIEILNLKDFMEDRKYNVILSMEISTSTRKNVSSIRRELKPFISKVKEMTGYQLNIEKIEDVDTSDRLEDIDTE